MRLLVVTKPTNFELHGERVKANLQKGIASAESMLSRLESAHRQHKQALSDVTDYLERRGVEYRLHQRAETWPADFSFDLVLTVGGDGTLLYASHHVPENGKIVGIRSSDASVGFTCLAGSDEFENAIDSVLEGNINFVRVARGLLEVQRVEGSDPLVSVPVLNDILFANCRPAATTRYRLGLGTEFENQKSSGVWISTSVGSTAAILAAGGTEQDLSDRNFQYMPRELYRPAGKMFKLNGGLFDPEKKPLVIENRNESAMVALDGQHGEILLQFGDQIRVRRGPDLLLAEPEHKT